MTGTKVSQNVEIITLRGEKRFLNQKELFWLEVLKEGYLIQDPNPENKGVFIRAKNYIIGRGTCNIKIGLIADILRVDGYLAISVKYKHILSHHLSFLAKHGYIPDFIDHKDGVKGNNHWSNLRDVTRSENMQNRKCAHKNSKSGIKGVHWHKGHKKWNASIRINTKLIHLGSFHDINDAIEARKKGELKYFTHAPSNIAA